MNLSQESVAILLKCQDYREFVVAYKAEFSRVKNLSYASIARRAGFSARSFPRDVATGKKRLTPASLLPFVKGLGLQGDLAEYFKTLVYRAHPEIGFPEKNFLDLEHKISNLRDRISSKKKVVTNVNPFNSAINPLVYAACGTKKSGASVKEIVSRTHLPPSAVEQALSELTKMGIVRSLNERFFPTESHVYISGLAKKEAFQQFFRHLLITASKEVKSNFESNQHLFFTSCFSVKSSKVPQLKEELRNLLLQYVDSAEDAAGDKVVSVVCSLL